jgi:hypothetical protein
MELVLAGRPSKNIAALRLSVRGQPDVARPAGG